MPYKHCPSGQHKHFNCENRNEEFSVKHMKYKSLTFQSECSAILVIIPEEKIFFAEDVRNVLYVNCILITVV